jgi:DegV family protein with EDD domain
MIRRGRVPTAVVTDTTAYLPPELVAQHGISLVSLYVNWENGSDREADLGDFDGFYERLRSAERLPTTSQPSIGDFIDVYEPLLAGGRDIVSIHISGGISGTVESARQAREQLARENGAGRITVVDSESACGGLGIVVLAAARAAAAGAEKDRRRVPT